MNSILLIPKIRAETFSHKNLNNETKTSTPVPKSHTENNWFKPPSISSSKMGTSKKEALIMITPINSILKITKKNKTSAVKSLELDSEKSSVEKTSTGWRMKDKTVG